MMTSENAPIGGVMFGSGTRVVVTVPMCTGPVVPMGATRLYVRTWRATVLGPVAFEPGMLRVRADGETQAVRVLTEYLSLEPLPAAVERACYLTELANAGGAR